MVGRSNIFMFSKGSPFCYFYCLLAFFTLLYGDDDIWIRTLGANQGIWASGKIIELEEVKHTQTGRMSNL